MTTTFATRQDQVLHYNSVALESPVFRLLMEDGSRYTYEPHRSLLMHENGDRVSLDHLGIGYHQPHRIEWAEPVSPSRPGTKKNPRRLKISMGFKCNYSCSYCSQAAHRYVDKKRETGDIVEFVAKLARVLPPEQKGAGTRIEFWGGEPFAYWPIFRPLAEEVRRIYPEADFMTITNGSMLDLEKIEWLESLNFAVGISHDGPGYEYRGPDPLKDPKKREMISLLASRLTKKGRFAFNCVLSLPNHSFRAIYAYLQEKTGIETFNLSSEGITSQYEPAIRHLVPKNFDEMRRMWRNISADAADPVIAKHCSTVYESVRDFIVSLAEGRPAAPVGQKCGMDRPDHIAVDLDGNVLTCQNVSANNGHKIGHLDDEKAISLTTAYHWANFENCRNCPVVQLCKGSCMYMEGPLRRPICDGHFTFNFALLGMAMNVVTGKKLARVEGRRVRIEGETALDF